jgi:GNAT superfamily N-acetyltransferase
LTDDPELFAPYALPLLAARPVESTLALTILEAVRGGHRYSAESMLFGWYDGPGPAGLVLMTPPHPLLLAVVPSQTVHDLVSVLRDGGVEVPGANGSPETVDGFAAAWTAGTSRQSVPVMHSRLYRLNRLIPPARPPAGHARLAQDDDRELVLGWTQAFQREIEAGPVDSSAAVAERIDDGRIWLWEDPAGLPVSLAGRQRTTGGVARVGPVYTPPDHRRHGYGTAVTAACTEDALRRDADDVVLFTDLSNPTSNAIYQQLGYEPVADRKVVRFTD